MGKIMMDQFTARDMILVTQNEGYDKLERRIRKLIYEAAQEGCDELTYCHHGVSDDNVTKIVKNFARDGFDCVRETVYDSAEDKCVFTDELVISWRNV